MSLTPARIAAAPVVAAGSLIALASALAWLAMGDAGPPAPERRRATHVDLVASHAERAELFAGPSQLIDLGGPGDARYTLDGFLRRERGEIAAAVGGPSLRRFEGGVADLEVPVAFAGDVVLRVCGVGPGRERLRVRVDRDAPPRVRPRGVGDCRWDETAVNLTAIRFGPGEHRVRVAGARPGPISLDWVRVDASAEGGGTLPLPASPRPGGQPLRVPSGWTSASALVVPPGARLTLAAAGPRDARLTITARRDEGGDRRLATMHVAPGPRRVVFDLEALAGELVRLDLEALGGDVTIASAVVDAPPERTAPAPRRVVAPKHVVWVLVDTLRADYTGPYGGRADTPTLDALARDAAVFLDARAPAAWTKPSVASLLTGWFPWQHLATTHEAVLADRVPLMPERLGLLGFETAAFVTNAYVSDDYGFQRGWDHFDHSMWIPAEVRRRASRAAAVARRVDAWLDGRPDPERPLFLYVHLTDPHAPYLPPADVLRRYDPEPYAGWADFQAEPRVLQRVRKGEVEATLRDREHLEALYAAEVTSMDAGLGALFQALRAHGVWDEALVVLTSDHGEELFDHGSVMHGHTLYDELLRIPLLVRAPGVTDGGLAIHGPASLVHLARTAYDALGVEAPADLAGPSLLPAMRGEAMPATLPPASERLEMARAVALGPYKLIETRGAAPYASAPFLYDLRTSPDEKVDVSLARPIALRALRSWLGLSLAATGGGGSARPRPDDEATQIGAATEAQLRALGYL